MGIRLRDDGELGEDDAAFEGDVVAHAVQNRVGVPAFTDSFWSKTALRAANGDHWSSWKPTRYCRPSVPAGRGMPQRLMAKSSGPRMSGRMCTSSCSQSSEVLPFMLTMPTPDSTSSHF